MASIPIVNGYAPTEKVVEEKKTKFWDKLEGMWNNTETWCTRIFNAKIGEEGYISNIAEKHIMPDEIILK